MSEDMGARWPRSATVFQVTEEDRRTLLDGGRRPLDVGWYVDEEGEMHGPFGSKMQADSLCALIDPAMHVFGADHPDLARDRVPLGEPCVYCHHAIVEGDAGFLLWDHSGPGVSRKPWHRDCLIKTVAGPCERHGRMFCDGKD